MKWNIYNLSVFTLRTILNTVEVNLEVEKEKNVKRLLERGLIWPEAGWVSANSGKTLLERFCLVTASVHLPV